MPADLSLDDIRARCTIDADTGCWRWPGPHERESGRAMVTIGTRWWPVVRYIALRLEGRPGKADGCLDIYEAGCRNPACANPAHITVRRPGHRPGGWGGGIRTLEHLRQRCRVDEETGCWHWSMAMDQKSPRVHVWRDGVNTIMRGRRAALFLANGRDIPRGHRAFAVLRCVNDDCCNPAHARSGTRAQWGEYMRRSGKSKTVAKTLAVARSWTHARQRRLTDEQADYIRASDETYAALAQRFGVALNTIIQIRKGLTYRSRLDGAGASPLRGSSVFAWMPSSAGAP